MDELEDVNRGDIFHLIIKALGEVFADDRFGQVEESNDLLGQVELVDEISNLSSAGNGQSNFDQFLNELKNVERGAIFHLISEVLGSEFHGKGHGCYGSEKNENLEFLVNQISKQQYNGNIISF